MKVLKTFLAVLVSVPVLLVPVRYLIDESLSTHSEDFDSLEVQAFEAAQFGDAVWMTENLKLGNSNQTIELFTYQELDRLAIDSWSLPTQAEVIQLLKEVGFNFENKGVVHSNYYKVNWEYPGYIDPIIGKTNTDEKLLIWIKDEGAYNYISIEKDELTYSLGKTLPTSKLAVRLVKR